MFYRLRLRFEAFHVPTDAWHVHETTHGLRAVSRKHALDKGLKVVHGWPGYADRAGHPDWRGVTAEAAILEEGVPTT